jgi:hypothetical protein
MSERIPRLFLGLSLGALLAVAAGLTLNWINATPRLTSTNTPLVPFGAAAESSPAIPATVSLPVPYTPQAPLMDWAVMQHACEEATVVMVDRYLRGDHSGALIPATQAETAINQVTAWKPYQDLTDAQLGELAQKRLGWSYRIYPATPENIKRQLALGRPVIAGVRTHGLGNPNYPGYGDHHEQPGWSVSHYLVVAGYDANTVILNDPGITHGHGYHITFDQLFYAIKDLDQAYPNLNQGLIILVLAPTAS